MSIKTLEMGGEEGSLDLNSFVAEQLKLLGLEREAEIAEASDSTFNSEGNLNKIYRKFVAHVLQNFVECF